MAVFFAVAAPAAATADQLFAMGAPAPPFARSYESKPGPWGHLEYTRIAVAPPEETVQLTSETVFTHANWIFRGFHRHQVEDLFRRAHLNPDQLSVLLNDTYWQPIPGATLVRPDRGLVLGLTPESRQIIYGVLSRAPENYAQAEPFIFHAGHLEECFEKSGVSEETIASFKRLLYGNGRILLFADADPFMSTLPDYNERLAFLRSISRRFTVLARLVIKPDSDVETISEYWDFSGRRKEIFPLLESLTRLPGGAKIDLAHLIPPFARKRIYTFPPVHSGDGIEAKRNCHWSALNFFNEVADDRFCEPAFIQQTVLNEYDLLTTGPYRLGDLMVLADSHGDTIHSAVYLADDLVYTKNGAGPTQPWLYMHVGEVLDLYASSVTSEETLQLLVFRRKSKALAQD